MAGTSNNSSITDETFSAYTTARRRLEFEQCRCDVRRSGRVDGRGMAGCGVVEHLVVGVTNTVWWCLDLANRSRPRYADRGSDATTEYASFVVYVNYRAIYFDGGSRTRDIKRRINGENPSDESRRTSDLCGGMVWWLAAGRLVYAVGERALAT